MKISLVAALSKNFVIGKDNRLPWHLPEDLQHFKQLTVGKSIIMGRKTFTSIGKALPKRHNIVITRDRHFHADNCTVVNSFAAALGACDSEEAMIIGGGDLYQQALPYAHTLYLTLVDLEIEGDTFFPRWDKQQWEEIESTSGKDESTHVAYRFVTLRNKNPLAIPQ